jgi:hypothetical protein
MTDRIKHRISIVIISWMILVLPLELAAQFYHGSNMSFGKSRVQYNDRLWTYYRFEEFDTYFYLNGRELALYTAWYAQQQLPLIERRLETVLNERLQFIVFNSLSDLKESNIGLAAEQQYNTGGVTHILGTKVILFDEGNYLNFEKQIRAGIADILLNQVMFGGSIGSQIRNTALFTLPDWYKNGMLSFLSEEWNTTLDNRLRDGILSGRYEKLNRLTGEDAIIAGHAFWRYIEEKYGQSAVPNIMHMTQLTRNVQNGFTYVTGLRFKNLIAEWYAHYKAVYSEVAVSLPNEKYPFKYRDFRTFDRPTFSPDERYMAYSTNEEGRIRLWLFDQQTGKRKRLFRSGYSSDEKTDYSYPLMSWHPSGEILAYVVEDKGRIWLNFYNLTDETTQQRHLINFQKITHISYAGNGQMLAFAAVRQGKPNIYVFEIASNTHIQVTDDYYTDLYPTFINGTRQIVFSSNRPYDTITEQDYPAKQPQQFDLFLYDFRSRNPVLRRITSTARSNEIKAQPYAPGVISYLSDANGYYNLYTARFDSAISFVDTTVHYRYFVRTSALTNFSSNIIDYSKKRYSNDFALVMFNDNKQMLYRLSADELLHAPAASLVPSPFMAQKIETFPDDAPLLDDFGQAESLTRKRFRVVYRDEPVPAPTAEPQHQRQGAFIIDGQRRRPSFESDPDLFADPTQIREPKRRNYFVEYFFDELVTQVDFTFINYNYQPFAGGGSPIYLNPGFNVFLGVNLTDLMEDFRISGGVRLNTNLTNNEYIVSFSNLRRRLNRQIILHRQSIEEGTNLWLRRTHSHSAYYILSWPFSETTQIRGTGIFRNDMQVYLATDQVNLRRPNNFENWGGLRGEFIFDNSRQIGMNLYTGIRSKVFGEYYQLIDADSRNLIVLGFDMRHYKRLHRNFIWANRIAGSTSFGNNKLIYYMGGVDNWLIPKFTRETPIDFNQNYAYQTLATNMRGFEQNIRNGNSFVVLNSEFRFPVFSYLMQRPISSEFIRNFQLVAFGDIGTAWTGWNPYNPSNSLYTTYIESGPLNISVEVQKDPIVGGMGFGARTMLLGYFVRGDMAWGIEDNRITKPIFYISLSLDF